MCLPSIIFFTLSVETFGETSQNWVFRNYGHYGHCELTSKIEQSQNELYLMFLYLHNLQICNHKTISKTIY